MAAVHAQITRAVAAVMASDLAESERHTLARVLLQAQNIVTACDVRVCSSLVVLGR
jgi:hypothetical protein